MSSWSYWRDGPLPPSHPAHPFNKKTLKRQSTKVNPLLVQQSGSLWSVGTTRDVHLVDIEDLDAVIASPAASRASIAAQHSTSHRNFGLGAGHKALTVELQVFANGVFMPAAALKRSVQRLCSAFAPSDSFVVRITAPLVTDVVQVNGCIRELMQHVRQYRNGQAARLLAASSAQRPSSAFRPSPVYFWVEMPCTRLDRLLRQPDSMFQDPSTVPALQVRQSAS